MAHAEALQGGKAVESESDGDEEGDTHFPRGPRTLFAGERRRRCL